MSTVTAQHEEMRKLTKDLASKSEKMRVLARAGFSRGDIARFLGTSYQFVRNVLVREEARAAQELAPSLAPAPPASPAASEATGNKVKVGPDGKIVLPTAVCRALRLNEGDVLFVSTEEGEIHLMTKPAAVRRAQAMVRQFVPAGVSLVEELLEDRRREVEREQRNA